MPFPTLLSPPHSPPNPNPQSTVISTASSLAYPTSFTLDTTPPFGTKQKHAEITATTACRFTTPPGCCEEARSGAAALLFSRLFVQWQRRNRCAGHFFALPVCLSLASAVSSFFDMQGWRRPSHVPRPVFVLGEGTRLIRLSE